MKMDLDVAMQSVERRRRLILAFVAAALVAVAAAGISPVGYVGAGHDDDHYLAAARCWVAHSAPCVPTNHWWARWPLIAPIAGSITLLGESRFSVQLAPALWWALALGMTGWLGNAWFGWRSGAIAVALLGSTPVVAIDAFNPNIDVPELALQLCALAAATAAYRRQSPIMACAAGLLAGLAVQARETSLLFLVAAAVVWFTLPPEKRKVLGWSVAGVASAQFLEMLAYALAIGDPLTRFRLAIGHTNFPTDQLPNGFHSDRGPILNPDFMRSWKREMHVNLWWPIDPWLNLFASPLSGMLLATGTIALAFLARKLPPQQRRGVARLLCGAMLIALGLVYVLAVDPKTRMFMALHAALSIASGAAIAAALDGESKGLPAALALIPVWAGVFVMAHYTTSAPAEARARTWIARYGADIEIFPGAASYLTFMPEVRALSPSGSGRRYLLTTAATPCDELIDPRPGHGNGVVIDSFSDSSGRLCLFKYLPLRASVLRRVHPA